MCRFSATVAMPGFIGRRGSDTTKNNKVAIQVGNSMTHHHMMEASFTTKSGLCRSDHRHHTWHDRADTNQGMGMPCCPEDVLFLPLPGFFPGTGRYRGIPGMLGRHCCLLTHSHERHCGEACVCLGMNCITNQRQCDSKSWRMKENGH